MVVDLFTEGNHKMVPEQEGFSIGWEGENGKIRLISPCEISNIDPELYRR